MEKMTKSQAILKLKSLIRGPLKNQIYVKWYMDNLQSISDVVLLPSSYHGSKKEYYYHIFDYDYYLHIDSRFLPIVKIGSNYYELFEVKDNDWYPKYTIEEACPLWDEKNLVKEKYMKLSLDSSQICVGDMAIFNKKNPDHTITSYPCQVTDIVKDSESIYLWVLKKDPYSYLVVSPEDDNVEYFKIIRL